MRDKTRSTLEGLLDTYDSQMAAEKAAMRDRGDALRAFEAAFASLCTATIRPVFEEFGRALDAHGHHFRVIERERYIDLDGKIRRSAIELEIRPKSDSQKYDAACSTPGLSVTAYPERDEVVFIERKASAASGEHDFPRGSYAIERLSKELVEEHLIGVAEQVFS